MMETKKRIKVAIVAGASHALKFKEKNPNATEDQILQHITKESENILKNIDDDEDF
jgi:hypothetical protein